MLMECLFGSLVVTQMAANVPPPVHPLPLPVVIDEMASPVIIQGKRADQLSDDELKEFLQGKVLNITHEDGEVQLVRVAPGYPVTLAFQEAFHTVIVGDPQLIKTDRIGRNIVLTALGREGDTSVQVLFPGNKLRIYHVFIAPNFLTGQTALRVASFSSVQGSSTEGQTSGSSLDIRRIARVISNYDVLIQEKALDPRTVKRFPVFRTNPRTGFTIYYLYRFAQGPLVISFAFQNPYEHPIRYDESRLRLALGNLLFIPDYTSFHRTTLNVAEVTTGFAVVRETGLSLEQPFEIAWK